MQIYTQLHIQTRTQTLVQTYIHKCMETCSQFTAPSGDARKLSRSQLEMTRGSEQND